MVSLLLRAGLSTVFADSDIRFRKDPIPELLDVMGPGCDYVYQQNVEDPRNFSKGPSAEGNTGFYLAKPSPPMLALYELAVRACKENLEADDQTNFWIVMRQELGRGRVVYVERPWEGDALRAAGTGPGKVTYCPLDVGLYATGWVVGAGASMLAGEELEGLFKKAKLVHSNYIAGWDHKRELLTKAGLWNCDGAVAAAAASVAAGRRPGGGRLRPEFVRGMEILRLSMHPPPAVCQSIRWAVIRLNNLGAGGLGRYVSLLLSPSIAAGDPSFPFPSLLVISCCCLCSPPRPSPSPSAGLASPPGRVQSYASNSSFGILNWSAGSGYGGGGARAAKCSGRQRWWGKVSTFRGS